MWRACQVFKKARQGERTITVVENTLHSGQTIPDDVRKFLEDAYRETGRTADTYRAATKDPDPAQPRADGNPSRPQSGVGFF